MYVYMNIINLFHQTYKMPIEKNLSTNVSLHSCICDGRTITLTYNNAKKKSVFPSLVKTSIFINISPRAIKQMKIYIRFYILIQYSDICDEQMLSFILIIKNLAFDKFYFKINISTKFSYLAVTIGLNLLCLAFHFLGIFSLFLCNDSCCSFCFGIGKNFFGLCIQ